MKMKDYAREAQYDCRGRRVEKMPLVEMKDTLDNGGRVTLLIRHAERPPLDPGDLTFGASLSLTESGWCWAHNFGLMLANNLLPKSVAFYASETFRTLQTACAMAMGLDLVGTGQSIERKVRLAPFLGSESPFFGSVEKRMELAAEGWLAEAEDEGVEPSSFPELDAAHEVERCVAEGLLVPPGSCATPEEMAAFVKMAALPVKPESTGASGGCNEEQVEL